MLYVKLYVALSVCIGIIYATCMLYFKRQRIYEEEGVSERLLDENVKKGHIQKEIFGDRKVYFERDFIGEKVIKTTEVVEEMQTNYRKLYLLLVFIVGTVLIAIRWPKELYDFIKEKRG